MRLTLVGACLVTLLVAPLGCAHWAPLNDHVTQASVDPAHAYSIVVKVIGERGYNVIEQRDAERFVRVRAHIDEKRGDRQSFITAQVDASGRIAITPSGFLVRDNKVHSKLASEVTYLEDAVRGELNRAATAASASAAAAPPPLPPPAPEPTPLPSAAAVAPAPLAPSKPVASKPASTTTKAPAAPKPKPASGDDWVPVK
jgi:hypothetical protein